MELYIRKELMWNLKDALKIIIPSNFVIVGMLLTKSAILD